MNRDNVIHTDTWKTLFGTDSTFTLLPGRCPGFNVVMITTSRTTWRGGPVQQLRRRRSLGEIGEDFVKLGRGLAVEKPRWRGDLPPDSAASALVGRYLAPGGALPYGDGPFDCLSLAPRRAGLVPGACRWTC